MNNLKDEQTERDREREKLTQGIKGQKEEKGSRECFKRMQVGGTYSKLKNRNKVVQFTKVHLHT